MANTLDPIAERLDGLRSSLAADGGSLEVVSLDGTTLRLAMSVDPEACQDCIVPDEMLEQMVLANLADLDDVTVEKVAIDHGDPL